jgi:PAS domain S-box-containing protein
VRSTTAIQFRRLRRLIATSMVLAILFGGLTFGLHMVDEASEDAAARAKYNDRLARGLAAHAGTIIRDVDSALLRTVRTLPANWQAAPEQLKVVLRESVALTTALRNIVITDADGRILADALMRTTPGMTAGSRAYFQVPAASRDDTLFISPPLLSRFGEGMVQVMSRAVRSGDGTFLGVVAALIDPDRFRSLEDGFDLELDSRIALLGLDGAIRYINDDGDHAIAHNEAAIAPLLQSHLIQRFRSSALFDGIERDYTIYPLAGYALNLVVGIPPRSLGSLVGDTLHTLVLGLSLLISLVIAMGLGFLRSLRRSEESIIKAESRERQFRDVARSVPGMLYQWRWTETGPGQFTWVGEGSKDILGLRPEEFLENQHTFRVHPDDRARWRETLRTTLAQGTSWNFEGRFILHDGSERLLHTVAGAFTEVDGAKIQNGVALDVTDERRRESRLADTQGRLDMLLSSARDAIVTLDETLHITHFNKGAETLFGRTAAEMIGNTLAPLLPADFRERHDVLMHRMQAGPDGSREMGSWRRVNGVRADGSVFPLLASISKTTVLGKPILSAIMRDMSEEAESERSLTALAEERQRLLLLAEQANSAKSKFLAVMSHELRTPLNAIIGFAEVMQAKVAGPISPPKYADYIDDILLSGRHLLSIINDILDLTKLQEHGGDFRFEPLDPIAVAEEAVAYIRTRVTEKAIAVTITDQSAGALVQADHRALRQMLLNLLGNAVKFTPADGRIAVQVRKLSENGCVVIEVLDNGPGVNPAMLSRLGKPFTQERDSYRAENPGTGLGLAIVVEMAAAHRGSVSFRNRPEGGFCAALELPVVVRAAQAA